MNSEFVEQFTKRQKALETNIKPKTLNDCDKLMGYPVILLDVTQKKAVIAANIAYKDPKTGKLVGGTISQPNGMALIDSNYDIEISHVAYKPVTFKAGTTIPFNIYLEPMVYEIPEVVVTPAMQQNRPKPQKQNQTVTHEPSLNNEVSKWKKYAFIGGGLLLLATVGLVIASKGKKK